MESNWWMGRWTIALVTVMSLGLAGCALTSDGVPPGKTKWVVVESSGGG